MSSRATGLITITALAGLIITPGCSGTNSNAGPDSAPPVRMDTGGTVITEGRPCDVYCKLTESNCTGANGLYSSSAICRDVCLAEFLISGKDGDVSGSSVQCRITHAQLATEDAITHCAPASESGGGVCGDWCEVYCQYAMDHCRGSNQIFADAAACNSACAAYATSGKAGDSSGDTVQCRVEYAGTRAHNDPASGCAAAQVTSSKTIGGSADGPCR